MKKLRILTLGFLAPLLFSGCFVGKLFQDTTIKRYKSANYEKLDSLLDGKNIKDLKNAKKISNQLVDVEIFSTKITKASIDTVQKSLWNLDGEGESKLLEILNKRADSDKEFFTSLEKKYLKVKNKTKQDYSTQNIKMILSISKWRNYESLNINYSLADRIEYLKIRLKNDDNGMHFLKWNKFETEYGALNIGDVTFNESISVAGGLNATRNTSKQNSFASSGDTKTYNSSSGITPSLSFGGGAATNETQKIWYRYISLNGRINKDFLEVEQEGIRDIDLAGNVIIDVQMKFDKTKKHNMVSIKNLPDIEKMTQSKDFFENLAVEISEVILPDELILENVNLNLNFEYVYRNVTNKRGRKTFFEWDDNVKFYGQNITKSANPILTPKDYMPQLYTILSSDSPDLSSYMPREIDIIEMRDTINENTYELKSLDDEHLNKFLDYLKYVSKKIKTEIDLNEVKLRSRPRDLDLRTKINQLNKFNEKQITLGKYKFFINRTTEEQDSFEIPFTLKEVEDMNIYLRIEPYYNELNENLKK